MVTLALIGVGKWGRNYLRTASALKDIQIKYICAKTKQTLNLLPDSYHKTLSIKELLKDKNIDGFIIATPESTHFSIAKQLLSQGRNLLIEKPFATNYKNALELKKIWQSKKTKVLVGHLYLYNPAYQLFKKLFKRMRNVKSIRFEGTGSPLRKVPVVWDWGPHPISLFLDLINQSPIEISAHGSYHTVEALIKFSDGIKTSIHISYHGTDKTRLLSVEGDNEIIELDDTKAADRKVLIYRPNQPIVYPKYKPGNPLAEELTEFVQAIKGLKEITSDMYMGVYVTRVLSVIEESIKKDGKLIEITQ